MVMNNDYSVSFHLVFVSVSIASADARICEETDDGASDGHSPPDQSITIFQRVELRRLSNCAPTTLRRTLDSNIDVFFTSSACARLR